MQGVATWPEKPLLFLFNLSARIVKVQSFHLLFEMGHLVTFLWPVPALLCFMSLTYFDCFTGFISFAYPIMEDAFLEIFVCLPTAEVSSTRAAVVAATAALAAENVPIG